MTLHAGEFILQAVGSKYEVLAMTDVECVCYRFSRPESFCEGRYRHIVKDVVPPLIFFPLKICSELNFFLEASKSYLAGEKICRELLQFKQKELAFILWHYYSDYELSMLVHSLSEYTDSFQYFVLKNYDKVKTVEEFAELGGYTATTFRRIFTSVFHQLCMSGCRSGEKKVFFMNFGIRTLRFLRFVISMALNLCLISPISVRRILDCLLAA